MGFVPYFPGESKLIPNDDDIAFGPIGNARPGRGNCWVRRGRRKPTWRLARTSGWYHSGDGVGRSHPGNRVTRLEEGT